MKIKQYIIVLLAGVMLPLGQLQAQITSLDELKNDKSYTIRQLPAADNNQKVLYATTENKVAARTAPSAAEDEKWAVWTSEKTGYHYVYNLDRELFLSNTSGGCTVSSVPAPCYLIETSQTGQWLLANNDLLTGLTTAKGGVVFSKNADLDIRDISFSLTDANRALTTEEMARIEQAVSQAAAEQADSELRSQVYAEIEALLAEALRVEKLGKPDFAGNYSYEELADIYNNDKAGQYTVEQLQALLERTRASIYPQEGKYYRLINKARPNDGSMDNTLTICDAMPPMNLGVRQIVEKIPGKHQNGVLEPISLFQVIRAGSGNEYVLYHPGSHQYAGAHTTSGEKIPLTDSRAGAGVYNLQHVGDLLFRFQNHDDNAFYLTANGESNCVSYDQEEEPEKWYLQEVKSIDLQIGSSGYATLCLPCAIELPEEVEAYVATSRDGNVLHLTSLSNYTESRVLPRYVPVVLKRRSDCTDTEFSCPVIYDAATPQIPNLLKGLTLQGNIEEGSYILYQGADKPLGFYKVDPNSTLVYSNKAYLPYQPAFQSSLKISFDGELTGVELPEMMEDETDTNILYDLTGRRVIRPEKGIYISTKGKKLLMK